MSSSHPPPEVQDPPPARHAQPPPLLPLPLMTSHQSCSQSYIVYGGATSACGHLGAMLDLASNLESCFLCLLLDITLALQLKLIKKLINSELVQNKNTIRQLM